jgi:ribosomal protein S6--L-glutamate ligase
MASSAGWHLDDLRRAAADRHEIVWLDYHRLSAEICDQSGQRKAPPATSEVLLADCRRLGSLDAVLTRSMPAASLEAVVFRMDVLARAEALGIVVVNSAKAVEAAVDKYLTTARLAAAGLRVPRTIVCQTALQALEAFHALGRDVVVKPLFGGEGRGVARLTDEAMAERAFGLLASLGSVIYLQQFVPHPGCDYRVLLVGKRAWAIERRNPLDWRTNVSRGAVARAVEPTDAMLAMARQAAAAIGAVIAGVDLLADEAGELVAIEVNAAPGWRATSAAHGADIAAAVIECLATDDARRVP